MNNPVASYPPAHSMESDSDLTAVLPGIRVCVMYGDYPPKPSGKQDGGADFVAALCETLAARGIAVTAVVSRRADRSSPYVTDGGVHVLPVISDWTLRGALRGQLRQLTETLTREQVDIVHLVYPDPYLRYGSDSYHLPFLLKAAGARRLLVTFFGFGVTGASPVTNAGLLTLFATADRLVITDLALLHRFQKKLPIWGHKARHGFVGSIAPDPKVMWSLAEVPRHRAELGLPPKERLLGFFGFWSPDKGIEDLLSALVSLRAAGENVKLVLIGGREPPLRTQYERTISALVATLNLEGSVIETGPMPPGSIVRYLLSVDLCVLPFRVNPLGRSSLAMALTVGVPTVVSRPSVGEELLDGLILVKVEDPPGLAAAIHRVLIDPYMQTALAKNAARLSAQWSWGAVVDAYLKDYRALVGAT